MPTSAAYDGPLERVSAYQWRIPRSYKRGMRVDGLIYASERMIKALQDSVVRGVKTTFNFRPNIEGEPSDGWLLADFGDVILHIFSPAQRGYYQLEELWSEARVMLKVQ